MWKTGEMCTGFWWGDLTERVDLKDTRADGKIILKYKKQIKVKFILEQATKAQRGKYIYSSTLSLASASDGCGWSKPRPGRFAAWKDPVPII